MLKFCQYDTDTTKHARGLPVGESELTAATEGDTVTDQTHDGDRVKAIVDSDTTRLYKRTFNAAILIHAANSPPPQRPRRTSRILVRLGAVAIAVTFWLIPRSDILGLNCPLAS